MTLYNLTKYSDNYSKTSDTSRQYCTDEPNTNKTDLEIFRFK